MEKYIGGKEWCCEYLAPNMEHRTAVGGWTLCKLVKCVLVLGWFGNVVVHRVLDHCRGDFLAELFDLGSDVPEECVAGPSAEKHNRSDWDVA